MIAGMFGKSRAEVPPDAALAARPVRAVEARIEPLADGGPWRMTVWVRPPRWAARFLRLPVTATKTFEFDAIGVRVWESCDGRTSVRDIAAGVAAEYGLTAREAEVATRAFLHTLALKGLVGVAIPSDEECRP